MVCSLPYHLMNQCLRNKYSQKRNCVCHSPNFHIHVSVSDLYIPTIDLPILLQEICRPILGIYNSLTDTWMWIRGRIEAARFRKKEYINVIFVAVWHKGCNSCTGTWLFSRWKLTTFGQYCRQSYFIEKILLLCISVQYLFYWLFSSPNDERNHSLDTRIKIERSGFFISQRAKK